MINNTGTATVETIWISNPPDLQFNKKALKNMTRLRMLGIEAVGGVCTSSHDDTFKYLSNSLRYIYWSGCPWESLPAKFERKRLVQLNLECSSLSHSCNGTMELLADCHVAQSTQNYEHLKSLISLSDKFDDQ